MRPFRQCRLATSPWRHLNDLTDDQQTLAAALATEWLDRAATTDGHPDQATTASELAYLDPNHEEQGLKEEATRAALNGAARLKWFAPFGMAFAGRFVNKTLPPGHRIPRQPGLHEQIQQRLLKHLDENTRVIVGHSLGSVVAYEIAAAHLRQPLPLLLTLVSPLGLRSIVYARIQLPPPTYPTHVSRWVNVADRNDLVTAQPDLAQLFQSRKPANATLESSWTVSNGAQPHRRVLPHQAQSRVCPEFG